MICFYCNGTGKYNKPLDEEYYSEYFDKFYDSGLLGGKTDDDMSLTEAGYEEIACPYCKNGIKKI
jgi:hypothetical protein